MCSPAKYIEDFVISPFPMVDARVTHQLTNVPGFNYSNSLLPGLTIIDGTSFPGPASCP